MLRKYDNVALARDWAFVGVTLVHKSVEKIRSAIEGNAPPQVMLCVSLIPFSCGHSVAAVVKSAQQFRVLE